MQMQKWRNEAYVDVINLILGAWLFVTPWIFGFAGNAAVNAWIVGALIALVAIAALMAFTEWEEWVNLVLAIWAFVAPWNLGFDSNTAAMANHVIVGIIVAVLAAVELWVTYHKPPQVTA
jgi:SPW repeat